MTMDKLSVTGVVVDRDHKDGTKANGDAWDKYSFQIASAAGRNWYSSFDKASWDALKKGEAFQIFYSEKENPNNSNHPFRNLEWWKEADPEDIPKAQPQAASPGTNGGDWVLDPKFRTKVELRWTEAWHMASRLASPPAGEWEEIEPAIIGWAQFFYDQLAQYDSTAGPVAASDAPEAPETDVQGATPSKASIIQALKRLNGAREERGITLEYMADYVKEVYEVESVRMLSDSLIEGLIDHITNGELDHGIDKGVDARHSKGTRSNPVTGA